MYLGIIRKLYRNSYILYEGTIIKTIFYLNKNTLDASNVSSVVRRRPPQFVLILYNNTMNITTIYWQKIIHDYLFD